MSLRPSELWAFFGSMLGFVAFAQTFFHNILPSEVRLLLRTLLSRIVDRYSSYTFIDIPEFDGFTTNEVYSYVKLYLSSSNSLRARRFHLCRPVNASTFSYSPANNEWLPKTFSGAKVWWAHQASPKEPHGHSLRQMLDEKRCFTLKVHKNDKDRMLVPYLEHVIAKAKEMRRLNRDRLLYINRSDSRSQPWESVAFKHPSTFETLALDQDRKAQIMADLRAFSTGEDFYRKAGRAWKRGYLLYGPPGTGKSSMIAAMANFLGYDLYDLELTEVRTNAELRKLLTKTTKKSMIVIEDIDCSLNLTNRSKKRKNEVRKDPDNHGNCEEQSSCMTLSGLLNFTDGLWSCCGDERIFVFTTNHIQRLDPALLRSGRMDVHISMSCCTFPALKILVSNYLGLEDHALYSDMEQVIDDAHMTPADVSEILLKHRDSPDLAMEDLAAEMRASRAKPWPPQPVDELSVREDAAEEKHTLEDAPSDDSSKQSSICEVCKKLNRVIET